MRTLKDDTNCIIKHYLIQKGLNAQHSGFDILVEAIRVSIENPYISNAKRMDMVAKQMHVTSPQNAYNLANYALNASRDTHSFPTVNKFILSSACDIHVILERLQKDTETSPIIIDTHSIIV